IRSRNTARPMVGRTRISRHTMRPRRSDPWTSTPFRSIARSSWRTSSAPPLLRLRRTRRFSMRVDDQERLIGALGEPVGKQLPTVRACPLGTPAALDLVRHTTDELGGPARPTSPGAARLGSGEDLELDGPLAQLTLKRPGQAAVAIELAFDFAQPLAGRRSLGQHDVVDLPGDELEECVARQLEQVGPGIGPLRGNALKPRLDVTDRVLGLVAQRAADAAKPEADLLA